MRPVDVEVEEHDALPDGCYMRFSALEAPRPVRKVRYEAPSGAPAVCEVLGLDADDRPVPAMAVLVDSSSAGQDLLVHGGAHGLRLSADGESWAEPYLLLEPGAVVE
jgi:hypothetical protein